MVYRVPRGWFWSRFESSRPGRIWERSLAPFHHVPAQGQYCALTISNPLESLEGVSKTHILHYYKLSHTTTTSRKLIILCAYIGLYGALFSVTVPRFGPKVWHILKVPTMVYLPQGFWHPIIQLIGPSRSTPKNDGRFRNRTIQVATLLTTSTGLSRWKMA
jgi:hypothetical protein